MQAGWLRYFGKDAGAMVRLLEMKLIHQIPVWGKPQQNAVEQMKNCVQKGEYCALMADHHLGYAVPIGGVIAYQGRVSPSGVGFDIACGNKAIRLDCDASEVRRNIVPIMDDIWKSLSFGVGRSNPEDVDHDLFYDDPAWEIPVAAGLKDMARSQLGTIGSGNHYVDLFEDEQSRAWVGVHFGSRGLGHKLASHFIKAGGGKDGMFVDPVLLDVNTELGAAYVACMTLAGRYAYAGRDWVCHRVASILGASIEDEVHNHHNFAWEEEHHGSLLWVVRKGATPAFPGQRGFVGGSIGEDSKVGVGPDLPTVLQTHEQAAEISKAIVFESSEGGASSDGLQQVEGHFVAGISHVVNRSQPKSQPAVAVLQGHFSRKLCSNLGEIKAAVFSIVVTFDPSRKPAPTSGNSRSKKLRPKVPP